MKKTDITPDAIRALQKVDVRTVDRSSLRDIRDIEVETDLERPKEQRMLDYIKRIGNPFCYRHGQYVVKISYANTDVTLEERIMAYIRSKC